MAGQTKLVIGASGFLGSHVTRALVARGDDVRVMLRTTSSTKAIDDLDVERCYGDVFDDAALASAMNGCDDVFYCAVDTRAWLRDPAPLFRTNVEGLRHVLDAAVAADLHRFVFTSSLVTIGLRTDVPATEEDAFNWADKAGGYIRSRVEAENLVLRYANERGLPAVAMCVSNTYGPRDFGPTPHGAMFVATVTTGKVPFYIAGAANEVVGIEDAAAALLLAADHGRNGERYIVSERTLSARELAETAAAAVGVAPPRFGVPLRIMYALGYLGDALRTVLRRDLKLSSSSVRLLHTLPALDHGKAERELGWRPAPVHDAIGRAAVFYTEQRKNR